MLMFIFMAVCGRMYILAHRSVCVRVCVCVTVDAWEYNGAVKRGMM